MQSKELVGDIWLVRGREGNELLAKILPKKKLLVLDMSRQDGIDAFDVVDMMPMGGWNYEESDLIRLEERKKRTYNCPTRGRIGCRR